MELLAEVKIALVRTPDGQERLAFAVQGPRSGEMTTLLGLVEMAREWCHRPPATRNEVQVEQATAAQVPPVPGSIQRRINGDRSGG